jgi:quercetin dioxygenase-like cupin family protein
MSYKLRWSALAPTLLLACLLLACDSAPEPSSNNAAVRTPAPTATQPSPAATPAESAIFRTPDDSRIQWGPCPPVFEKGCDIAVLHGDPMKGASDAILRVPPNYAFPTHHHTSPEHIVLASGEMQLTYEGQEPFVLKPGSYVYGPSQAKHKARCVSAAPCVWYVGFESPVDAVLDEGTSK